jgi:hypothetical protein
VPGLVGVDALAGGHRHGQPLGHHKVCHRIEVTGHERRSCHGDLGRVVVVADSSKLGRTAFARICPIIAVNMLITDGEAPDDVVRRLEKAGVDVRRV